MANNTVFTNKEKQIFTENYPLISEEGLVKTAVVAGDVIGMDTTGNLGKYDKSVTYTTPYAVAYEDTAANKKCPLIVTACLMEDFVKLPADATEKRNLKLELRKLGIFIR